MLTIARRFALGIAVVALAGCDDGPLEPPFNLFIAQARWQRANIDSYELTVRVFCECLLIDPVRVTVSGGVIVSRVNVVTGQPVPENVAESFPDVPGLFAIVDKASAEAHDLEVEYDASYGFPTVISIDWNETHVDDEVVYRVENFGPRPE